MRLSNFFSFRFRENLIFGCDEKPENYPNVTGEKIHYVFASLANSRKLVLTTKLETAII